MKRYKNNFSEEELSDALNSKTTEAKLLIGHADRWETFKTKMDRFIHKAYKLPLLGNFVDDIISMMQMVDSYVKKQYTDVPLTSIISAVTALVYVLSPIDLILDTIPGVGYLDDVAVILFVLELGVGHDLEKYKLWQEECRMKALIELEKSTAKVIQRMLGQNVLGALILCENKKFRVLSVNPKEICLGETPYTAYVHYLKLPMDILRDMYIETEEEYLGFLNGIIDNTSFEWSPIGKLKVIHEVDYEQYEEYFALTGVE